MPEYIIELREDSPTEMELVRFCKGKIVRCKDCYFREEEYVADWHSNLRCTLKGDWWTKLDGYCHYGRTDPLPEWIR